MEPSSNHWNTIFSNTEDSKLGWYEKDGFQTLKLLNQIPDWEKSTIFIPGAGTSILIEKLLSIGANLVLNDISIEALNRVKSRLNKEYREIDWFCQDIAKPIPDTIPNVDIWIDRAVLHFLINEDDIKEYFKNVESILKVGGHAIFAEFSKKGATKCAGLTIHRYSIDELSERLGESFTPISHFDYTFINPNGDPRPYIYALYKRENNG